MKKSSSSFWLFLAGFYLTWILRATWFYGQVDLSIPTESGRLALSLGLKILVMVVPAIAYLKWIERADPLTSLKVNSRPERKGIWIGSAASILFLGAIYLFTTLSSGKTFAPLGQAPLQALLLSLAGNAVSSLCEEILFRGFMLSQLQERMSFWAANGMQAVLFVAVHWPNWLWTGGYHWNLLTASASILILALFLGWLFRRTQSLWPGVIVHVANNFLAAFLG